MITRARKKQAAIISDNLVVFNAICDNTEYEIQLFDSNHKDSTIFFSKLDLLIIDKNLNYNEIPSYRVNSLINLTGNHFSKNEITLHKPFKLEKLLAIISSNMKNQYLFCCINDHWIYNQRLARISSVETEILLTDKENDLFVELLTSNDFSANKEYLKNKIWNYHQDTESTTVETHLYKLKQKLPKDFLEIKATQCCLYISSLV
jgi:hypothetical protein